MAVLHVSSEDFEEKVLKSDKPVLVDFWATWCGPCQMQGPIVEELADSRDDILVCKIDTDKNPDLARAYRVMSIPTLMVFEKGEVKATAVGLQQIDDLEEMIG